VPSIVKLTYPSLQYGYPRSAGSSLITEALHIAAPAKASAGICMDPKYVKVRLGPSENFADAIARETPTESNMFRVNVIGLSVELSRLSNVRLKNTIWPLLKLLLGLP
jgi:hypothetical protein